MPVQETQVKYLPKEVKQPDIAAIFSELNLPWGQSVILVFENFANKYIRLGKSSYQIENIPFSEATDLLNNKPN